VRNISQQKEQEAAFRLDIGNYTRILWRKKYFLLVPLAIAFIVASIGVRFLVPEYESTALIRIGNPDAVSSEVNKFVEGRGKRSENEKSLKQLEADILGSNFLDELIRKLGIDRDPEVVAKAELQHQHYPALSTEELVYRRLRDFLKRKIKIESDAPELFRISYADANPDACYVITDAITELYIEKAGRNTMTGLGRVEDFSDEQMAVAKERLQRSEQALADYQASLASQRDIANPVHDTNVAISEKERADLQVTIRASEATLEKIRGRISTALGTMPSGDVMWRDPELNRLSKELGDRREAELLTELGTTGSRSTLSELDPVITSQQALQRRMQQLAEGAYPNVPIDYRPLLVEYFYQQAELQAYKQKLRRLDQYIGSFRSLSAGIGQTETELSRLRGQVERDRELFNTFERAKVDAGIGREMAQTELAAKVFLVERASKPVAPVRPDKLKILVLCFLFGATVGAAGLLLTEFTDSSYRSVDEVERQLGLRVLGTIPRVGNARWSSETSRKRTVVWVAVCVTFVCVFIGAFYFYGKSTREGLIDLNPTISTQSKVPQP
jgi:succinoglycan biosynthesis transport protein ExoP